MGWAYYVRGKLDEAREYIGSSYKAQPKPDPEVSYHYGCVMMDLGFLDDAEKLLQASLEKEERPDWRYDVQKRLSRIKVLRRQGVKSKKAPRKREPVRRETKREVVVPPKKTVAPKRVEPPKKIEAPKKKAGAPESRLEEFKRRMGITTGKKKAETKPAPPKEEKKEEEKKDDRRSRRRAGESDFSTKKKEESERPGR
jgi:hypothetical protein